jgi:hypothetical protein
MPRPLSSRLNIRRHHASERLQRRPFQPGRRGAKAGIEGSMNGDFPFTLGEGSMNGDFPFTLGKSPNPNRDFPFTVFIHSYWATAIKL